MSSSGRLLATLPIVAAFAAALSLGCAPRTPTARRPSKWTETLSDGTRVVCQMERSVGSNIAEPVCHKENDFERDRERGAAQRELIRPRATPAPAGG